MVVRHRAFLTASRFIIDSNPDIYGDEVLAIEDDDEIQSIEDPSLTAQNATAAPTEATTTQQQQSTQPPSNVSYSAQIAKQFSSYNQTPSQERQPRNNGSGVNVGSALTQTGGTGDDSGVFGKKPSEMHDAG